MSFALIDADLLAYRSAVTAVEDIDWGDGQEGNTVNTRAAVSNALSLARTWHKKSGCSRAVLVFSPADGNLFRRLIDPTYKEGRVEKPECYWSVVQALEDEYKVIRIPWLEADDTMGIMATSPKFDKPVIVSADKDMLTIPARICNPLKDGKVRKNPPREADRFWMYQTLCGDRVDGYPGCPGIGDKKATRALEGLRNLKAMWAAVVELYVDRGLTPDDALLQARLARILRRDDYDKDRSTVYLWHPTEPVPLSLD